jgi:tRNA nucleotidyltransferase/poly(A) polymerase
LLERFGLSALAFAWRPLGEEFCDPTGALDLLSSGLLDVVGDGSGAEAFRIAPRRYWIAARLLSEYNLEPTPRLVAAARTALPSCRKQIPEGSPARRELQRVLIGQNPMAGLRFLHQTGLFEALFPGTDPSGAEIVGRIDANPSLRWAVSLEGASAQRAMRRLRMPPRRAREIERLLRHHPIDRTTAAPAVGDAGVRRLRQRLHPEEIEYLLGWRSIQLEGLAPSSEILSAQARLVEIRTQLESLAGEQSQSDRIKALAIDGAAVMKLLGRGPGRYIGQALAHLAEVVAATPEANEVARLEVELQHWAKLHPE